MTNASRPLLATLLRSLLLLLLLLVAPSGSHARLFGGPKINGDTYSYDGKGDIYDPTDAFSPDDAFNHITLSNWDMAPVAELAIPKTAKTLTLLNCNLSVVPEEIAGLDKLEGLTIAANRLTAIDAKFASTLKLTSLNLTSNQIIEFNATIPTLQSLDLSKNALADVPRAVFASRQLTGLYITGNNFKIETVTIEQFDFYAGLGEFHADFVQVSACANGSDLVNLKGSRVCRLQPGQPTPAPTPTTLAPPSSAIPIVSPAPAANSTPSATVPASPSTVSRPTGDRGKTTYIAWGMVFVLLAIGLIGALYMFISRRQTERMRGQLHEETPLFFDSDKRTTYHQELTAGDKLFPSNDPVLVTWRIDYDAVKLVRRLAKGAFGEVWIGRYRGHKVAVKRLLEEHVSFESSEDFIREIKLMAWLKHPKIIEFVGVAWTRLVDMLAVTEFMDSGDLRSLLDSSRDLTWSSAKLQYAMDTIDAIVYLHSLNPVIIHRDLKSRNILVDSKKGAKLGDFGISAAKRDRDMTSGVGTTRWIAPELARGETHYTEAVDIYSFGVILSELDTHELPFQHALTSTGERLSDFAILQGVANGSLRVRFTPSCPAQLRQLAERCIDSDPTLRPSAAEVSYLLRQRDILLGGSNGGFV